MAGSNALSMLHAEMALIFAAGARELGVAQAALGDVAGLAAVGFCFCFCFYFFYIYIYILYYYLLVCV
jgi:hypothetical protein